LGSILLDVAIAAPIHEEAPAPETTHNAKEATGRLNHVSQNEIDREIFESFSREGIPYAAIREFFDEGFNTYPQSPLTPERFARIKEWGKKWNIEKLEKLRYDAEKQTIIIDEDTPKHEDAPVTAEPEEPTTTGAPVPETIETGEEQHKGVPIEEINAWAIQQLREVMRGTGMHPQAIDEMFEQGFHLLPMTMEKYFAIQRWGKKWNVKEVENMTFSETVTDDETPSDTVHVEPVDEVMTITPEAPTTEDPEIMNEKIRQHFRASGIPESFIEAFIAEDFAREPLDEEKVDRFKQWNEELTRYMADKHKETHEEATTEAPTTEFPMISDDELRQHFRSEGVPESFISEGLGRPPFDEEKMALWKQWHEGLTRYMVYKHEEIHQARKEKEVGAVITRRVAQFFENLYMLSRAAQHFSETGEMDQRKTMALRGYVNNLSELERNVFEIVTKQITKKTLAEYGI
ncbi:hypothetical protein PENTCL1PPCAC_28532, partial [Pristionchus entomophagus]